MAKNHYFYYPPNMAIYQSTSSLLTLPQIRKVTKQSCQDMSRLLPPESILGSFDFGINKKITFFCKTVQPPNDLPILIVCKILSEMSTRGKIRHKGTILASGVLFGLLV